MVYKAKKQAQFLKKTEKKSKENELDEDIKATDQKLQITQQ